MDYPSQKKVKKVKKNLYHFCPFSNFLRKRKFQKIVETTVNMNPSALNVEIKIELMGFIQTFSPLLKCTHKNTNLHKVAGIESSPTIFGQFSQQLKEGTWGFNYRVQLLT